MAPVICKTSKTVYYPAPKSASSTLREIFFEIENGYRFKRFLINGHEMSLFWLYGHGEPFKPVKLPPGYEAFAVIRDPIGRFLSFYNWGVIDNRCGFDHPVEINAFVADFKTYLNMSPKIGFHLSPQHLFIGRDLSFYSRIFRTENLAELGSYLSQRSGRDIHVGKVNGSSTRVCSKDLTPDSRKRLVEIYKEDYALLEAYYSPDTSQSIN